MAKAWRVQAREDHFVVLGANGDEMLVSVKEYATPASAKRAAHNAVEALRSGLAFEVLDEDGNIVTQDDASAAEASSAVKTKAKGTKIKVPTSGKTVHALNPYAQ